MEYAVDLVGKAIHPLTGVRVATMRSPRRIAVILLDGFSLIHLGRLVETFDAANRLHGTSDRVHAPYELLLLSAAGGAIRSSSSALIWSDSVETRYGSGIHAVFVLGGDDDAANWDERLLAWLRRAYRHTVAVRAVGGGRGILKRAGLHCKSVVDADPASIGVMRKAMDAPHVDHDADDALTDALFVVQQDCGDDTARAVALRLVPASARRLLEPD